MMRIALFLLTNLAVMVVASITLKLLGIDHYTTNGSMGSLLAFCAVFGMTGSIISLLMSKTMAKMSARVQIIKQPANDNERWLLDTVQELSQQAGIGMPEVGIFPAHQSNAFATGWNRNNALVAVSEGLLRNMRRDEVKAVIGHEIAHVANGDMITLSLIQGVVNTFVMFFARIIGSVVDKAIFRNENEGPGIGYMLTVMVFEIIFGILASTIVMWFSRRREYRADAGGAALTSPAAMIGALEALRREQELPNEMPDSLLAFGINSHKASMAALFMSHPPLEKRIAALRTIQA